MPRALRSSNNSARLILTAAILACLAPGIAGGQTIPEVGTAGTFDIATWNIEWFGATNGPSNDALQFRNVLTIMRQAGVDLWAVQEIADPADFTRLLDSLGTPFAGQLATQSGQQRVGFIYNTDLVSVRSVRHVLTAFAADFATRPPLQLEADVTIADSTRRLTFITVHMKCCGGSTDHEKRLAASGRLKNHIDFTALTNEAVVVLGDLNDELDNSISSGRDTPYRNFLDDPTGYSFLTLPLDQAGLNTFCSSSLCSVGSTLDHIIVTNELFADVESGTTDHFIELTSEIAGYTNNTSDHLPVFARLRYGISTSNDGATGNAARDQPQSPTVVYPNPANTAITASCRLGDAARVDCAVEVFDLMGRRVASRQGFAVDEVNLSTRHLSSGMYLVTVTTGTQSAAGQFIVAR